MKNILGVVSLLIIVCACAGESEPDRPATASDDMVQQAGQGIVSETFGTLSGNLSQAMGEGGVPLAIEFCSVEGIPLTERLSEEADVEIRRASHRPRNPVNRANEEEMEVIEEYLAAIDHGDDVSARFYQSDDSFHYYAPIRVANDACLQCHGDPGTDISQDHLELISSHYPEDEGTGFSMGDLRGIWSVRIPADSVSVQEILDMLAE